ncbi:MAG: DNA recombination protein RmuC [Candidatus Wildermuthbacteria bacterium]|nr:DNA recombination protein RmuC [Candidatus Wildermuthbacteria bacterium]
MDTGLILFTIIVLAGIALAVFFIRKEIQKSKTGDSALLMLQNQLNELRNTLDTKLGDSAKMFQTQYSQSAQLIENITEKLTRLDETNKQVLGFSDQLQKLQDILRNPKHRGILGEYYLEALLKQAFHPKQYQLQYRFRNGDAVDAVLFLGEKLIPIDSKFSLENYNKIVEEPEESRREELERIFLQDLKNRIEETAKYIRPEEGTMDFAFMFIPAEGIYYDLLINKIGVVKANTRDLLEYAIREKHVHIVSPTTFYVTLQSLWQSMRAYQVQESTKEILKNVGQLSNHLKAYDEYLAKLGTHLGTTVNTYNLASKEFRKIDKDILKLTGTSNDVKIAELQQPSPDPSE